jgi:RND family efflux transporter MFP subunit
MSHESIHHQLESCNVFKPYLSVPSAIILSLTVFISSCSKQDIADVAPVIQPVKVVGVTSDASEPLRQFPGRVAASETANIASKVAGQVKRIHVQPGDEIEAGDLLLEIDSTDYELNLEQAQANYNLAKVSFERVESSRKQNIATQADYDNAKSNYDKANVGLKQANNQLTDTRITAPFDGRVVRVNSKEYDFVGAAQPLVHVQSIDNIDVKFQVPSDIVARLSDNDDDRSVGVIFDALPGEEFKAEVGEFSADSDRSTRSFDVTLTLKAPPKDNGTLLPGMDATVLLDLSELDKKPHLTLPSHTVFKQDAKHYVWVVIENADNEDVVIKTEVTLGALQNNVVEITSGLTENQQVVSAGIHKLVNNQNVVIWGEK